MKLPVPSLPLVGYALAAGLALGALAGWRVTAWIHQGRELVAVRTALAGEREIHQKNLDTLRAQVKTQQDASYGYQQELQALRAKPRPTGPVRLCVPARARVPAAHPDESRPPETAPGTGILPEEGRGNLEAGADIGPSLRGLWDEADNVLAQCRGLQRVAPR